MRKEEREKRESNKGRMNMKQECIKVKQECITVKHRECVGGKGGPTKKYINQSCDPSILSFLLLSLTLLP